MNAPAAATEFTSVPMHLSEVVAALLAVGDQDGARRVLANAGATK